MLFLLLAISAITLIVYYCWCINTYFSRRGIEHEKPKYVGAIEQLRFPENFITGMQKTYHKIKGRFGGFYLVIRPAILIKDPELVKRVLIKDFDYFVNRGLYTNEKNDPLTGNLFMAEDERWKYLRNKFSPSFSSGKLKQMFPLITDIGNRLQDCVQRRINQNDIIEIREIIQCYTTDVITSVAFGLDVDCLNNPNDKFRKMGELASTPKGMQIVRDLVSFCCPQIAVFFGIRLTNQELEDFMRSVTLQSLNMRENQKIVRHDFMQLLVKLRNGNTVDDNDPWHTEIVDEKDKQITVNETMAQIFIFFLGGFETSSTTISFALYELAKYPDVQRKLQNDIDAVLKKHDGLVTYESLHEMKYLEQTIDETLRMYPPLPVLFRRVSKPYHIPNSDIILDKGELVLIDNHAMQNDSKYFEDPKRFDPERFSPENKAKITPYTYIPFGDGPRNCIGMRLGMLQSSIGLFSIISKFSVELAPDMPRELVLSPLEQGFRVSGGIRLRITPRKTKLFLRPQ